MDEQEPFRIAFICTANRARSAIAHQCTARATRDLPVDVQSAGTRARSGYRALDEAVVAARGLGFDLTTHSSRRLPEIGLERADLVIGFELGHIAAAVVDGNARPEVTFTLKEFMRLSEATHPSSNEEPVAAARKVVEEASNRRAQGESFVPGEEITDPVGREQAFFRTTFEDICQLCSALVLKLFKTAL